MDHQEAMSYAWGNANNPGMVASQAGQDLGMEGPNSNRIYAPEDGMNDMLADYNFARELDEHMRLMGYPVNMNPDNIAYLGNDDWTPPSFNMNFLLDSLNESDQEDFRNESQDILAVGEPYQLAYEDWLNLPDSSDYSSDSDESSDPTANEE